MRHTETETRFGSQQIPRVIKLLIITTCSVTIGVALLEALFGLKHLTFLLALSQSGLQHFYLWQPLTSLFLHQAHSAGVTLSLLIELLFNMYILWFIGSAILERIGEITFLSLYLVGGAVAQLATLGLISLAGSDALLNGSTAPLFALLFVWTMQQPDAQLLLFFVLPVRAKWLVTGIVGALLLMDLSSGDWINFISCLTALLAGYSFGLFVLGLRSPFEQTHRFDDAVIHFKLRQGARPKSSPKIVDIRTGRPIVDDSDDAFIDAMLDKISRLGEQSLTPSERARLKKASENKRK